MECAFLLVRISHTIKAMSVIVGENSSSVDILIASAHEYTRRGTTLEILPDVHPLSPTLETARNCHSQSFYNLSVTEI